ncbi:MAG: DUF167 domain-containing protein [Dehalococcoidia bacterium]|nr:DUF167 domain-containing protein [Dehalococcoidia bacterium]
MAMNAQRITVRVQPRASRDEILGLNELGALRVRVKAPPVDDAANEALVQLLAKTLGVRKSSVTLVSGETARNKIIEVEGLTGDELRTRLQPPLSLSDT